MVFLLMVVLVYVGYFKLAAVYFNKGAYYFDRGLYKQAVVCFNKSLKIDSRVAKVHYTLANTYAAIKEYDKAINEYEKTIKIDPYFSKAYQALAYVYLDLGKYSESLDLLEEASSITPADQGIKELLKKTLFEYSLDYFYKAIIVLQEKADFVDAETKLIKSIRLNAGFWPSYKLLGDIYFEKGDFEKSVRQYKLALELDNDDAILYNDTGIALMKMEHYAQAIGYMKKALELSPDNINILYGLASVYRDNKEFQDALVQYGKVVSYKPDYPNVHNDLGDIYKDQGKEKEAKDEYLKEIEYSKRKLSNNIDDTDASGCMAYAYKMMGEFNKAEEINRNARAISLRQPSCDKIYLKNGRFLEGKITEETSEKISLEISVGKSRGTIPVYRNTIDKIIKSLP